MFDKKWKIIVSEILLVVLVVFVTIGMVNPFGFFAYNDLYKLKMSSLIMQHIYYEKPDKKVLVDGAIRGLAESVGDPYTTYMNKSEAESFLESVDSDDYTGVGLYITNDPEDNRVTVISPLAGTPAEKAGLVTGDKIIEIDGKIILGKKLELAAEAMKGKEGTDVKLKVLKHENGKIVELTLKRAKIRRETVTSDMVNDKYGIIRISQFGTNTFDEFAKNYNSLAEKKAKGVIIDLRNNPGGYLDMAAQIADMFINTGDIVYTMGRSERKNEYKATNTKVDAKLVIITNGGTASAAEILTGALRDSAKVKIVGEKTFGKGITQCPYKFKDGSILKFTDSRYYTPSGKCINKVGITPDYEVKMSSEQYQNLSELDYKNDPQIQKAIEILAQ